MAAVAYYNEFDGYAAAWLRNLISAGHLPAGDVDERSIVDVAPSDLAGYTQCHFFAGIGGWSLAARLAGWPDDLELWTGSAPCQPFSVAGQQRGTDDDRHLWPHLFRLASARRPAVLMGEQVAAAVGKNWLDGIAADLEGIGYACGAVVVPAAAVDAPHRRDRLWFVAHADRLACGQGDQDAGRREDGSGAREVAGPQCPGDGAMADPDIARASEERQQRSGQLGGAGGDPGDCLTCGKYWDDCTCVLPGPFVGDVADGSGSRCAQGRAEIHAGQGDDAGTSCLSSPWQSYAWIIGHDGKARRVGTRIRRVADGLSAGVAGLRAGDDAAKAELEMIPMLAHGVLARVGKLRAFGNAIVPAVAAEVIGAYMDCMP